MSCGCQTEECSCHSPLHGWTLGALTPQQATEQIFPAARERSGAGHDSHTYNEILASVQAGQIVGLDGVAPPGPQNAQCQDIGKPSVAQITLSDVTKGAMTVAPFTGPAAPFIELGASIAGLFQSFFNHHAQAVAKERSILCAAVPAANNYLQVIDQAVQNGQSSPQDGINALNSLVSSFEQTNASITHGSDPTSSGECNAACRMNSCLRAIVAYRTSQYQDLIDGAAATAVTPARPNVVASPGASAVAPASSYASFYSSTPAAAPAAEAFGPDLPIAAMILAGFFLLRSL